MAISNALFSPTAENTRRFFNWCIIAEYLRDGLKKVD